MVATVVRINKNNYFVDKSTNKVINKYDPSNHNLVFIMKLEDSVELRVDSKMISTLYGGYIGFEYESKNYIIDDGYRDTLIKCGYIVLNDFDTKHLDKEGISVRDDMMKYVSEVMDKNITKGSVNSTSREIVISFNTTDYNYTVKIETINSLVYKNQQRKENDIAYYPFDKEMDKYGTLYFSIFAQKNGEEYANGKMYTVADSFISKLISLLNENDSNNSYHFHPVTIKRKVLAWEGI